MAKLVKGDRISLVEGKLRYTEYGDDPNYGVITDELSDGRVVVKWDNKWMNDNYTKPIDPNKLLPEDEVKVKFAALEKEFRRVEDEVRAKMKEAGDIVLAAQKFAKEAGFELQEMSDATYSLEGAMEKAGWNTSSWHC